MTSYSSSSGTDVAGTMSSGSGGDTTAPSQVTGLNAAAANATQIDLTWIANSESDIGHYNVYRGINPNFPVNTAVDIPIASPITNSHSDTGLLPGTAYYYKVAAVDTSGNNGPLSDEISAITPGTSTIFYNVPYPGNSTSSLGSSTIRYGEQAFGSASLLIGKSLKEWTVYLKRTGSASGNITAVVRRNSDDTIVATFNEIIDASTLPTTFTPTLFTLSTPRTIQYGDRIMIEYAGSGSVDISIWNVDQFDGGNTRRTRYMTSYSSSSGTDVAGTMSS
jgi:hypothetical protein